MDLTKYTIIKASAGSGKTYRLTQELADRLANGEGPAQLHPSEIIATTFTRKAAQELKHRIREYLVDENQLSQASALPAALIGTVNSVTGRILQDFAVDIGLSPDLTVLTETAERRVFAIAVTTSSLPPSKTTVGCCPAPATTSLTLIGHISGACAATGATRFATS